MIKSSGTAAATLTSTAVDNEVKAIVSPTPTEDLEKSKSDNKMQLLKSNTNRAPPGATSTTSLSNKNSNKKSKAPSGVPIKSKIKATKKEDKFFKYVGNHDEINGNPNKNPNKTIAFARKKLYSSSSLSSSSLLASHPPPKKLPIMSRYCGCCGDILSTKTYGYEGTYDRRLRFHPEERIPQDRSEIQAAARRIHQTLASKGNIKGSDFLKKTTAANTKRKKKKSSKGVTPATSLSGDHHHQESSVKGLPLWPEESLRMDETILEGLLSLKRTPLQEVDCRCWKEPSPPNFKRDMAMTQLICESSNSNNSAVGKLSKKSLAKAGKTLGKKHKVGTKTTTTNTAPGETTTTTVSTKVVITKCPKTGKKIKKTVRTVKKLVKKTKLAGNNNNNNNANKKNKLPVGPSGFATAHAAKPGVSPPAFSSPTSNGNASIINGMNKYGYVTMIAGDKSSSKKKSSPSGGNKDNSDDPNAKGNKGSKKRSRDKQQTTQGVSEDEIDHSHTNSSDDDGSDGYYGGENSYNGPGISAKKRRRNDEKADQELRERLMNCPLEGGLIYPSQAELMELTTVRKRNALQTFYKRFNELRQFIAVFGDANVPQQFPENHSLGIWVNKMRMERKKWDTGCERTSLTERKIELLESIDFIWAQNHKGEIGWERRFQEIKKFKRKHGHCNVPTKSAENRALGRWVSTQRTMHKNYVKGFVGKSLTKEEQERRILLLLKEGFLFSMIPNGHEGVGGTEAGGRPAEEGGGDGGGTSAAEETTAMVPSATTLPTGGNPLGENDKEESVHTVAAPTEETTAMVPVTAKSLDSMTTVTTIPFSSKIDDKAVPMKSDTNSTPQKHSDVAIASADDERKATDTTGSADVEGNNDTYNQGKEVVEETKSHGNGSFEEKKEEGGDQSESDVKGPTSLPKVTETALEPEAQAQEQAQANEHAPADNISQQVSNGGPAVASATQVSVTTTPSTTPSVSASASPIRSYPEESIVEQNNAVTDRNERTKINSSDATDDAENGDKLKKEEDHKLFTNKSTVAENTDTQGANTNKSVSSDGLTPSPPTNPLESKAEENNSNEEAIITEAPRSESQVLEGGSCDGKIIETATKPAPPVSKATRDQVQTNSEDSNEGEPPKTPTSSKNTKIAEKIVSPTSFVFSPSVLRIQEKGFTTTVSLRLKDKPISRNGTKRLSQDNGGERSDAMNTDQEDEELKLVTSGGLRIIIKMEDPDMEVMQRMRSNSVTEPTQQNDIGNCNPLSAPSPSRRSIRARKPSARQLEAEKSPLRETILGR